MKASNTQSNLPSSASACWLFHWHTGTNHTQIQMICTFELNQPSFLQFTKPFCPSKLFDACSQTEEDPFENTYSWSKRIGGLIFAPNDGFTWLSTTEHQYTNRALPLRVAVFLHCERMGPYADMLHKSHLLFKSERQSYSCTAPPTSMAPDRAHSHLHNVNWNYMRTSRSEYISRCDICKLCIPAASHSNKNMSH